MATRINDGWDRDEQAAGPGWRRVNERILECFMTRPSFGAGRARLLLLFLICAVGFVDYESGIRVSLSVFYLVPVALAVSWFGWKDAVGTVVISLLLRVLGDFLSVDDAVLPLWNWWNSLAALTVMLIVVWLLDSLLSLRRQLEHRIEERTSRLVEAANVREQLEHALELIGARERNAFGQELHDDVCQHLVGTALAAKVHTRNLAAQGSPLVAEAQALVGWLEEGAQKTRRLARGLLMTNIDPDDLQEQLLQLIEDSKTSGVACQLRHSGDVRVADGTVAAQVFRIVQEALRNALKHAAAKHVEISLAGEADSIRVVIADDGRGIVAPGSTTDPVGHGMGLRIMAHRAASIGGRFCVEPAAGSGTRVVVHVPRVAPPEPDTGPRIPMRIRHL
jgi:signal transduction histidine kinase